MCVYVFFLPSPIARLIKEEKSRGGRRVGAAGLITSPGGVREWEHELGQAVSFPGVWVHGPGTSPCLFDLPPLPAWRCSGRSELCNSN